MSTTTSALPEPVHLTRNLPAYRALLEEQWRIRVAEITRLSLDVLDQPAGDTDSDRPRAEELRVAAQLIAATRQQMQEAEAALRRIETGTYGWCEQCHRPIRAERLDALPAARYCLPCQQRQRRTWR
jgi:RNA polymerase-binding transcription factor DksA